jgi:methionyl-tRNA formyltransferase
MPIILRPSPILFISLFPFSAPFSKDAPYPPRNFCLGLVLEYRDVSESGYAIIAATLRPMLRLGMQIVFMGTPSFAVPILRVLASTFEVIGVVTQPDRPAGRGRKLQVSEVKALSLSLNLPLIQPPKLRDTAVVEQLRKWKAEVFVVAAFGQILSQEILDMPFYGSINVHASLLPRWRGAAPIQAAILNGEQETGVTIMKMDAGVDTGPILSQERTHIKPDETSGELSQRLAEIGAELLLRTLPGYISGEIFPKFQDDEAATYAPMIRKSDGLLDFTKAAEELARQVRAYNPWPSSFLIWDNSRLVIHKAHAIEHSGKDPGTIFEWQQYPALATSEGLLLLELVQPAGRKAMSGKAFLRGTPSFIDKRL